MLEPPGGRLAAKAALASSSYAANDLRQLENEADCRPGERSDVLKAEARKVDRVLRRVHLGHSVGKE